MPRRKKEPPIPGLAFRVPMPGPFWIELECPVDDLAEMRALKECGQKLAVHRVDAQLRRELAVRNAGRAQRLLRPVTLRYKYSHGDRGPPRGILQITIRLEARRR